jgi:hypothetical protein
MAQHYHALFSPRPHESATLQALGEPVAVPSQQFDQIAAPAAELSPNFGDGLKDQAAAWA